jgi:protoporphyrinogen oxidase
MPFHYNPKVNDYVKWKHMEGWVYFKDEEYISIEIAVKDKQCNKGTHHKKDHLLILCYHNQWHELEYITSRESVHDDVEVPLVALAQ